MNTIDTILNLNSQITASLVVGVMVKILMVMLLILAMVMVRQTSLMNKVVSLPVGGKVKTLTWSYFALMLLLTAIVILA